MLDNLSTGKLTLLSLNGWHFDKSAIRQRLARIIADAPKLKDIWLHCQGGTEKIRVDFLGHKKTTGSKVRILSKESNQVLHEQPSRKAVDAFPDIKQY